MSGCATWKEESGNRKQIPLPGTAWVAFVHVLLPVDAESLWEEGAESQRTSARQVPWVPRDGVQLSPGMLASFASGSPLLLLTAT